MGPWPLRIAAVAVILLAVFGIWGLLTGAFVPVCASSEPISPGVCPPTLSYAEIWVLLIALALVIAVSLYALTRSFLGKRQEKTILYTKTAILGA